MVNEPASLLLIVLI